MSDVTARFESSDQLMSLGLMRTSDAYEAFCSRPV